MLKIFADKIIPPNSLSKEWLPNSKAVDFTLNNLKTPKSSLSNSQFLTVVNTLKSINHSISDYVKIITKKHIPVVYHEEDKSYTDYEVIVISGTLNDGNIDATVGLVMHESSHIVYTDFGILKKIANIIDNTKYTKYDSKDISDKINDIVQKHGVDLIKSLGDLKTLLNVFEDRRIDYNTTHNHPAYMGYYVALYYRYFNTIDTSMAFNSNLYNDEAVESYMFRLINIVNPYASEDALNGLPEIYRLLDLKNVGRFKNTTEILELSFKVLDIIYENCKQQDGKVKQESDSSNKFGKGGMPNSGDGGDSDEFSLGDGTIFINDISELTFSDDPNAKSLKGKKVIFSEKAKQQLREKMEKLAEKLDGERDDKDALNPDLSVVNNMQGVGTTLQSALIGDYSVIFVKHINESDVDNNTYDFFDKKSINKEFVDAGVAFGKALYKKVNVLNEIKFEKQIRKQSGHINKRLLHELPSNNVNIFNRVKKTEYGEYSIHVSIDISGSMSGNKLEQCIKTVAALSTLSNMLNNKFNICVSVRYEGYVGTGKYNKRGRYGGSDGYSPVVAVIYDSTKDKYAKSLLVLNHLQTAGCTPEGLCYNALSEYILANAKSKTPYFINFSDGEPTYSYGSYSGVQHTRDMVNKMRKSGIHILSYFISGGYYGSSQDNFITMYGKDSKTIDQNSITLVAKSLNEMFLKSLSSKMA